MLNKITVSVIVITYNHETFIQQCLNSILSQKCNFNFKIIVADDNSTDNTEKAIRFTIDNNDKSKIIHYFRHAKNKGMKQNFVWAVNQSNSKYIAICEGDDYWTDPYKLQKQVNILETNPDCVACHTWQKLGVYNPEKDEYIEKEAKKEGHGYDPKKKATVEDIFNNKLRIKSRTLLFKNLFKETPYTITEWFPKAKYGDVPLSFILGQYGSFYFIDEEMAVYRQTGKGVSTHGIENKNWAFNHFWAWVDIWCSADKMYQRKYHKETLKTLRYFYSRILSSYNYSFYYKLKLAYKILILLNQPLLTRLKDVYFCLIQNTK